MPSLTAKTASSLTEALRTWAAFDRSLRPAASAPAPSWEAGRRLMAAAAGLYHERAEPLQLLFADRRLVIGQQPSQRIPLDGSGRQSMSESAEDDGKARVSWSKDRCPSILGIRVSQGF